MRSNFVLIPMRRRLVFEISGKETNMEFSVLSPKKSDALFIKLIQLDSAKIILNFYNS